MNAAIITGYVEQVWAYALKHTFSQDEADDLAQEILLTAVRELPYLRDESRLEPWLWGIARNVTYSFRRNMGKQRAMFSYDMPQDIAWEEENDDTEELYALVREKLSQLSALYRDIIILYYYDNLSVKQIATKLNVPEGTVTWRLSEGRRKLKKECADMTETALRPIKMRVDIYGSGDYDGRTKPFPSEWIGDALSQNILYYCYERAQGIEELAKLCGVPAYYIEERMENLMKRNAVISPVKGKYQTDFIIWSDKYGIYCEENIPGALAPIQEKLLHAFDEIAKEASKIDFYKAAKPEKDLYYLYGVMSMSRMSQRYNKLSYPPVEVNYDGNKWRYVAYMESGAHHRTGVGKQKSGNGGQKGKYAHISWWFCGMGRQMMYDNCIDACQGILQQSSEVNKNNVAYAIENGYIVRREDGTLLVTTPSFTKAQKEAFDEIAERHLAGYMEEYGKIVEDFVKGYVKLFPKHLGADAARMCFTFFLGFYDYLVSWAQQTGRIEKPEYPVCDVMVEIG